MVRARLLPRCITAFTLVITLLFSQLALASYVCPVEAADGAMAEMMASGAPCEGMDTAQPVLCHQYSAAASATLDPVVVAAPSLPTLILGFVLPPVASQASRIAPRARAEGQPPPDPLFLTTLRLRV